MRKMNVQKFNSIKNLKMKNVIDVRNKDEYDYQNIPGSSHIPLQELSLRLHEIPKDEEVYLICQSGNRSKQACQILDAAGYKNFINIEGGITAFKKNYACSMQNSGVLPIMRQVMISAGILIIAGILLANFIHPNFILLSAFVGAGLLFSGLSGHCGMAMLLEKMPWNKTLSDNTGSSS